MQQYNIYVGGPMRNNKGAPMTAEDNLSVGGYDWVWRDEFKKRLEDQFLMSDYKVTFYDPVEIHNELVSDGFQLSGEFVYNNDCYHMRKCDVGVWNFLPFNDGYPMIGSLIEIGIMAEQRKKIIIISDNELIKSHPFTSRFIMVDKPEDININLII